MSSAANCTGIVCGTAQVTGGNLVFSLLVDTALGLLCYAGFVLWRGAFGLYHGRDYLLPGAAERPPALKLRGHWQLWSWLTPVWGVSDKDYLRLAGLDSLVAVRILAFGVALFAPLTLLGIGVLLPVNYAGGTYLSTHPDTASDGATTAFLRMTISNIDNGSPLLWIHFTFLVLFVLWACFLLVQFYEEHIGLRQTLIASELHDAPDGSEELDAAAAAGGGGQDAGADKSPPESPEEALLPALADEAGGAAGSAPRAGDVQLWPVPRPDALGGRPTLSRPRRPGLYCVIIQDEPAHKFRARAGNALFGLPLGLASARSLRQAQEDTNLRANGEWLQAAGVDEELARRAPPPPRHQSSNKALTALSAVAAVPLGALHGAAAAVSPLLMLSPPAGGESAAAAAAREAAVRMRVAGDTFARLFGSDFDRIVPVYDTRAMDKLLSALERVQARRDRVELALAGRGNGGGGAGAGKAAQLSGRLEALRGEEAALQARVAACREATLAATPCRTLLALFRTTRAAAMAVSLNINPLHWRAFHLRPGADPQDLNWPTLQRPWWQRQARAALALVPILLIMLFPLGVISGVFSQLTTALCGAPVSSGDGDVGSAEGTWFCSDDAWASAFRSLVTSVLPAIIVSVFQAVVLPVYLYACAQMEARHVSLSELELRCASLFFYWNCFNYFLGALLGGTVASGLRAAIQNPVSIVPLLGAAVPASANFFISYVMLKALTMCTFRLFYPHASVVLYIAKWFRVLPKPKTARDVAAETPLRNCRFSRDIGTAVMSVFIAGLGYAVIAPFILPLALLYFVGLYHVWRYQLLYVFQPAYDSQGFLWRYAAHRIVACLGVMTFVSSALFFVKGAWTQGVLALVLLEGFLIGFDMFLTARYDAVFASTPIALLDAAPRVELGAELYTAPPLRTGASGWYPEWGKAWQYWGAPRYC